MENKKFKREGKKKIKEKLLFIDKRTNCEDVQWKESEKSKK